MTPPDQIFHNPYLLDEIFSHMHRFQRYCDITDGDAVASSGLLKLLQVKAEFGHKLYFTDDAIDYAAKKGHLGVVQWLHKNCSELCWQGCTTWAMDWAAWKGHLDIIQWLHNNRTEGCTTAAMDWTAENNHLDVVKWLHENRKEGCTRDAIELATEYGHTNVVEWLHANYFNN